jgi:hypothetical protein
MRKKNNSIINVIKIILIVLCFLIINANYLCAGVNDKMRLRMDNLLNNRTITVENSIQAINEQKLIYENEFVILYFKVSDLKKNLVTRDGKGYEEIFDKLKSENESDFHHSDFDRVDEFLLYVLTDLLEEGQFVLIEKKTNKRVNKIIIKYYSNIRAALNGEGGRKFYLPDGAMFLEILDFVS